MNETDNSPGDEQQPGNTSIDYATLLSMTRPLFVTEHSLPLWRGGEICRSGFGISPEPADRYPESTLSRGEVLQSGEPGLGIAGDEELVAVWEQAGTRPALQMRICIGLS